MFKTVVNAWKTPDLKKKIVFTLVILLLYRLGSCIPVPYVNALVVQSSFSALSGSIFDYLTMLSGTGFAQANLFALPPLSFIPALASLNSPLLEGMLYAALCMVNGVPFIMALGKKTKTIFVA